MTVKDINLGTDLFSMFNVELEDDVKRKREEEENRLKAEELKKKVAATNTTQDSSKKTSESRQDFKVNEDTVIRYYGESIEITAYFSTEELAEGILVKIKDNDPETNGKGFS